MTTKPEPNPSPAPTPAQADPPRRRQRFGRHERIAHAADFRRAFERKRSASDAAMVVYGAENGLEHARLGLSVSRRKVGKAIARNRVKRLLREAFRLSKDELPRGIDLVVVPRGPGLTFAQARRSLPSLAQAVARRLGLGQSPRRVPPGRAEPKEAPPP